MSDKQSLLLMFERPQEPIFMEKGDKAVFDVPDNFLTERYRPIGASVQSRFGGTANRRIPVKNIAIPDLRVPLQLDRQEPFSLFIPKHRRIAGHLIDIFLKLRSIEDLKSVAAYSRDRLNPFLFNYALSVALLHRPDTKDLDIPLLAETFPDKYVDSKVLTKLREEATVVSEGERMPIIIPRDYTASDLDVEHRLWYFREDIGINLHHWHWHLVYPFEGDRSVVNKDRRGELFYYMHQQIIARYNLERFSNHLPRVKRLNNVQEPIAEGYFPKMDSVVAGRSWPPRFENATLKDLNRESDQVRNDVADLQRWTDRLYEAIHAGYVENERGNRIPLNETNGIDILGNLLEASILSENPQRYGDLHNMGHVFISYVHDPEHRHLETFGVMGDSTTAMRDPVFYKWHAYINDIFQEHKELLPPYTEPQLSYPGITVTGAEISSDGAKPNTLNTFWQQTDMDLSRGLDFAPRGNVFARFTHLQHTPFQYTININNDSNAQRFGTVRIFLGPKTDERGLEMALRDQRLLMIELDKFIVSLRPGQNTVRRRSSESTVTIPFARTFRSLQETRPQPGSPEEQEFNFCGCGWPEHMLIPKGRPEGLACQLFVMVSNYDDDRVDQDLVGTCNDASSYCGVRDRLYPDKRPMGYPFDRVARPRTDRLSNFITPNMRVIDCNIVHTDRTTTRP